MSDFTYLDNPPPADAALALLPPALAAWFRQRFATPTPAQRLAWAALARGQHVLLSAPTGAGKSLAAFVPLLADLLQPPPANSWSDSRLRVVYVAPLKALVNDAARSLEAHLASLPTPIRVAVRTGDTSASERRRLRDDPPHLLLTTPESLAVLLSQSFAATLFRNLGWLVLDEVHALAGNKRGADLSLTAERLCALAAEPVRRIGLSATATPLPTAARWLVGTGRPCTIARAAQPTPPQLTLEPLDDGVRFLPALAERLLRELPSHRSVLVFTNTRSLAERLGWLLRRRDPALEGAIAVHHSALAAGRRREVEARFKAGELKLVISSTSLELGIDIGAVDLAVLVHPPGDVVRLLQRVGRAGHAPGGVRRGLVLTATPAELLEAAVTSASSRSGQCEPLPTPAAPLDVVCQHLIGMCCARSLPAEEMFALVRQAAPYAALTPEEFDACLRYLRGVDAQGAEWLPARLSEDGDCWRVRDAKTARLYRRNLGTILAETTVSVVRRTTPDAPLELIGEVDEAFADRLQAGDRFLLDGRCLEFRSLSAGNAIVEEVVGRPRVPVWGGEGWPLSSQLAARLFALRTQAAEALREGLPALARLLREDYELNDVATGMLSAYFVDQETRSEIPEPTTLLIEVVADDLACELYLHTPLNRLANDALARVAVARLAREFGRSAQPVVADLGFLLRLSGRPLPDIATTVRQLLRAEGFAEELAAALDSSESLRTRFARVALTGLMLLREPEGRKRKVGGADWAERRLFEEVRGRESDFVLLRQARRELRSELCDESAALAYSVELPRRSVRCRRLSAVSPFAAAWTQVTTGEIASTESAADALMRLHAELMGG